MAIKRIYPKLRLIIALHCSAQIYALTLAGSPSSAQEEMCRNAISRISDDIERRLGGKVAYLYYEKGEAEKSPTLRKDRVNFQLGVRRKGPQLTTQQTQANSNILSSMELMRSYAKLVIRDCEDVAQVEIGLMWSDAEATFSLHSDGQIYEDKCLPFGDHPNLDSQFLRWGVRLCS